LEPELARIHETLHQLREQTQFDETSANSKILKVQDSIHQFENIDNDIKAYHLAGGDERLAATKKAVADLEKKISSIDDEIMALSISISEAESNMTNMKQLERNVQDNLKYREMQKEVARMRNKIAEMEKENAETEVDKYKEQAEKLRKANNKWTAEVPFHDFSLRLTCYSKPRWLERSSRWIYNCKSIMSSLKRNLKTLMRSIVDNISKSRLDHCYD
jgi:DNA repair protein RAD50